MVCFWGGQYPWRSCRFLPKVAALVLIVHAGAVLSVHTNNKVVYIYFIFPNQSSQAHEKLRNYFPTKNGNTSNFFFVQSKKISFSFKFFF